MEPGSVRVSRCHVADIGTVEAVVTDVVAAGESAAAALVALELEAVDGVGEVIDVVSVRVRAGGAMGIEGAAVASLDAFPVAALLCVGVRVGPEDAHVIEVLVAVRRRFVVVLADAISCAGRGVRVCHTWGGV